ncbi:arginine--tRNA ligase [Cytobacillus purgationiresistens]|uniref:arginine--tRNA ligase n=1 Tax=Cytobacillus purgationiresistens TaxID=863449 RepID=UPI0027D91764|nr:arginine--tRNA ligase [Cytobacillus purgationiresistens]
MDFKEIFIKQISDMTSKEIQVNDIRRVIEIPKNSEHGDLAFPCFILAKTMKMPPAIIAKELAKQLAHPLIEKTEAVGPYLNIFFAKKSGSAHIVNSVLETGEQYGCSTTGKGKTIVVDFSSPNIAKPFSMGHLRSAVIGQALANIAEKQGYQTVRINHIGDWGTQFGKLLTAYKKWGDFDKVKESPIEELFKLYVQFHEEAKDHPELDDEARLWFKKLENGDEEAAELWSWFRADSLKEFERIYRLLNIHFDSYNGEAFYNDKMETVVNRLQQEQLLTMSDGAEVVTLPEEELPPYLIKKSDGATLYATRDLAAAIYRKETYAFDQALYIVGQEQTVHFKQIKAVLKRLHLDWYEKVTHIPFGLYLKDGKKMSTRQGRIILLEDVLNEAIQQASANIEAKNPSLENKEKIAQSVGIGAILFHDLKNDRMNNIEFSLKDMLTFEGETGPYLQYTHARACSLLRKTGALPLSEAGLENAYAWETAKLLQQYPNKVKQAYNQLSPSTIAKHLIDVAQAFNKYYGNVRILEKDNELQERLALVKAVMIVLADGMKLLGMDAPEEM